MRGLKKQYAVLGLGRFGASVACQLEQRGHEVLAVDSDETLVNAVAPHVTQAVQADATDEAALQALDLASFDGAIVAIGDNTRASVLVTVLCKEAGVPLVIAKAVDELHARVLRKVGADRIVFPEQDMGLRVARSLDTPNMIDLMELSGDYRIAELVTPMSWRGRTMLTVNVRRNYGVNILGVRRDAQFIPSPGAQWIFREGDVLLLLGRTKDIENII